VHVAQAERAGAALIEQAIAHAVDVGADGRIAAIRFKRPDGSEESAIGKVFVIAAHGIETPKLLLQSRTEPLPNGVANSSGQVGRNLMDHPTQLSWALAGERLGNFRGPLSTAGIESGRAGDWRGERPSFRMQTDNAGWSWPTGAPYTTVEALLQRGLRGADLDRALEDHTAREMTLACMTEQLPLPENRIVPDFEKRDALGLPRPRIYFRLDDYTRRGLEHARRMHQQIFEAMKSTEIQHHPEAQPAGHVMGTYRMGTDSRQSVVNRDLRSHDHPNLFLLGSGVFPTGGASNPTLTIAALTLRTVDNIRHALTV
jgi:choline dehydrogenase-like flavoprotein